ncbi:noncanonical pyrimidine nucleotidase, YjjG family [Cryomorpha ignava]|uniref:Noncanonical pyrimidine nucleotidase, YjjG family n=1 Tax=Cryomorpha ignava TaxID=101383 RepID=A0A7K3WN24_9FLAO|nr:YjjG family noncanonical pyrimidine nucleotidase [Cryomorpha ignava]NEN22401.1 noncanonical pyrimidine nucleotidase, YjjG family [Cryomorpha ignava]
MRRYKHLFFDLDRTLWDFDTNSKFALSEIYDTFNLKGEGVADLNEFISRYQLINERLWGWYRMGNIKKNDLRRRRFSEALAHFGCENEDLGVKLDENYIKISPYQKTLMPKAIETLEYLSEKYALHIITNGFEEVQNIKMQESGLQPFFKHIITSERAMARKPDPIVFNLACKLAKTIPADSLMIGDDLAADILGAKKVWMDQVYFNPLEISHDHDDITFEIKSLEELKVIL